MKSFQNLISILSILFLVSCGQKVETTDTTLQIIKGRAVISSANAAGGIVVYGKNEKGDNFGRVLDPGGGGVINLMLPNGNWEFTAITWEGPTAFTGTLRCAFSPPQFLNGMSANVNLNLTNSNCSSPKFTPYYATTGGAIVFPNLTLYSCKNLSFSPGVTNTDCDTTEDASNKGYLASFKVILEQFDQFNNGPLGIHGPVLEKCIVTTAHAFNTTTSGSISMDSISSAAGIILPAGDGSFPMSVKIVGFFDSTTCAYSSAGEKHFTFPKGVGAPMGSSEYTKYPWSSGAAIGFNLYLKSTETDVCQGPRLSTNYAGGTGTKGNPYLICTPNQYNYVATNYVTNENLRLANDLNFTGISITPIGGTGAAPTPAFNGLFLGDKHTISNFKNILPESAVGLIRETGSGAKVLSLKIKGAYTSNNGAQKSGIGTLVGDGSYLFAKEIYILDSIVESLKGNYAGGVVGATSTGAIDLQNVHYSGVINSFQTTGGILGRALNPATIWEASFHGKIYNDGPATANTGGILGLGITTANLLKIKSSGIIQSKNGPVGGLVGNFSGTGGNIDYSYSIAGSYCSSGRVNCYAGGLVGSMGAGNTLQRSFAWGSVKSHSISSEGGVIGIAPSSPTVSNSYWEGALPQCGSGSCSGAVSIGLKLNSNVTGLGGIATVATPGALTFYKPSSDDTYDIPRLTWEVDRATDLIYLARPCSGNFATTVGYGTQASPYWVCTPTQFKNMTGSNYYVLKNNLNFINTTPETGYTSFVTSGAIVFDGDNRAISNLKMEITSSNLANSQNRYGIFRNLTSTGSIKNLIINNAEVTDLSMSSANFYQYGPTNYLGALVAYNEGTIENVKAYAIEMTFGFTSATTGSSTGSISVNDYVGMIAGANSGTISKVNASGMQRTMASMFVTDVNDTQFFGGISGLNSTGGAISKSEVENEFLNSAGSSMFYNFTYGGVVGRNDLSSTISEVYSRGDYSVSPSSVTMNSYYVGGIVGKNFATVSNSVSAMTLQRNSFPTGVGNWSGVAGANLSPGTISKVYYSSLGAPQSNDITFGTKGALAAVNSGTITNGFCLDPLYNTTGFPHVGISGAAIGTNILLENCQSTNIFSNYTTGVLSNGSNIFYNDWNFSNSIAFPSDTYTWVVYPIGSPVPAIPVGVARRSF